MPGAQITQNKGHLSLRQHDGQPAANPRSYRSFEALYRLLENIPESKEKRIESLILGGRRHSPLYRKIAEVSFQIRLGYFPAAFAYIVGKTPQPTTIGFLSAE